MSVQSRAKTGSLTLAGFSLFIGPILSGMGRQRQPP